MEAAELVYVAFTKYVVALDRATGSIRWQWKIPKGKAYPAILVDGAQVFVSAMGYTYCLDAYTGHVMWENELEGFGTGVASISTVNSNTSSTRAAADSITREQAAQQHRSGQS
jgi:outer membrane protein assembly factor BamB